MKTEQELIDEALLDIFRALKIAVSDQTPTTLRLIQAILSRLHEQGRFYQALHTLEITRK